ncbi:MAG: FtsW/RodA/SpoVE family cell cycle protein, partial [Actinobacteria bacterium]|nr:FtsW/RodA/SpoVE family cell cycle protein [Actinomycetota bacterium]
MDYASSRSLPRERQGADLVAFVRRLDLLLLGAVAAIVAYGLWGVAGITRYDVEGDEGYFVTRQLIAIALGFAGLLVALAIDPDRLRRAQRLIYGSTIVLMLLVFPFAQETRGSRRWIDLGPFQFQPSEFGKVLFVLALAGFLADRARRLHQSWVVLQAVALGAIPILLVFRQPDLGTA